MKLRGYQADRRHSISTPDGPLVIEQGQFVLVVVGRSVEEAARGASGYLASVNERPHVNGAECK